MKNTIIFDMDGVIIDSEPLNLDILAGLYKVVGIEVPKEVHLSSLGVASKDWWEFLKSEYEFDNYSIGDLTRMERAAVDDYIFSPESKDYIFTGVTQAVKNLKERGFKLALASASAYPVINQVLKQAQLEDVFDLIVSATDSCIKRGKPYPDIFLYAAEKLESKPEDCIVVEDSEQGLKAAKNAQMTTICFRSAPKPINTENADICFDEYSELEKIVDKLI